MTDADSARLVVQAVVIIAGSCLIAGALLGALAVAWVQGRRAERADLASTTRYEGALRSLDRLGARGVRRG